MDRRAIAKCQRRLRIATQAIEELEDCSELDQFADHWSIFLTAWKGIFTALEQGAKDSAHSRQWFGAKKAERKSDDLLQYLFQARNDEEHGLEEVVGRRIRARFAVPDVGVENRQFSASVEQIGDDIVMNVSRPDGGPIELVRYKGPHIALMDVHARGGIVLSTPGNHLGVIVEDDSPLGVARLGLAYVRSLVSDAERLCKPLP